MSASPAKIVELRRLLTERHGPSGAFIGDSIYATGFSPLDAIGVPRGALTEIVAGPGFGPGGSLLLYGVLHAVLRKGERIILIDGRTNFAPKGLPQVELNRLLWVRCRDARDAIKAADLAVRDGNVMLIVLMLMLNPPSELQRISASAWQRLQMLAEKSGVTLLSWTSQAQIGCARLRVSVGGAFPLARLHAARETLLSNLSLQVERRRSGRRNNEDLCRLVCA